MANRNSAGFGFIPVGTLGNTPATSGLSEYFKRQAEGQDQAVEHDLMREEHKSMPIDVDRQSRVTFGGTKKS